MTAREQQRAMVLWRIGNPRGYFQRRAFEAVEIQCDFTPLGIRPRTVELAQPRLDVGDRGLGREVQPTRLTANQRAMLQRLGFDTPAQILSKKLPRAP